MADERDRAVAESADAGDERLVVGTTTVAVQLDEVVEQPSHVVERVRPFGMTRELDGAPDLLVRDLRVHPLELLLEPFEIRGEPRAAEQAQPLELRQPLAKTELLLSRHSRSRENSRSSVARYGRSSFRGRIASTWPKR